jgi:ATP-dependent Clp protease ATP-binding subunit ClpA
VFERFSERGRQVVVLAQEEARTLRHNYVGTEHILLGLLREEEGLAARVLESLDITVERVRAQVVRIVGSGDDVVSDQIPFTPRAKKVLELSLREALSLHHSHVGAEHILLGLARENEGVATQILLDFGVDSEKIRDGLIQMMSRGVGIVGDVSGATAASPARAMPGLEDVIRVGFAHDARRVMMAAGARALDDARLRVDAYDLLLALCRDAAIAPVFADLGIVEAAVRDAIARRRRPEGPSEGSGQGSGRS